MKPLAPPPHPKLVSGTRWACTPKARLYTAKRFFLHGPIIIVLISFPAQARAAHGSHPTQARTASAWRLGRQEPLPQPRLLPRGVRGDTDQLGWEGSTLKGRCEVLRTGRQNGGERHGREKGFAPSCCVRPSFKGQCGCEGERCEGGQGSMQQAPATALGLRATKKPPKLTRNSESWGFHIPEQGCSAERDQPRAQHCQLQLQSASSASGPELRVQSLGFTFFCESSDLWGFTRDPHHYCPIAPSGAAASSRHI